MMDGSLALPTAVLDPAALSTLMPMHLWVGEAGDIRSVGPTLAKVCENGIGPGQAFAAHFKLLRPHSKPSATGLGFCAGQRLNLVPVADPETTMRGHGIDLEGGQGILLNLSFGINAIRAVRDHSLTGADFAPTDLTVELLYLAEVKAAVMAELNALNGRIDGARQVAETQALTDALTGLANRRAYEDALGAAISASGRGAPFALVHLDLDYFKAVNDTLGHAAGDLVLTEVAGVLRRETRQHDTVARIGGDEFVLILSAPATEDMVRGFGRRIIAALERPIPVEGAVARISGSLGVTFSTLYTHPAAERMQADADAALYTSKRMGRARATIFVPGMVPPDDHADAGQCGLPRPAA
jgi:diguanylate cyclase